MLANFWLTFRATGIVLKGKLDFCCNGRLMCYDEPDIYFQRLWTVLYR